MSTNSGAVHKDGGLFYIQKSPLFSWIRAIFENWKRIGRLFVKNSQTPFQKRKTDVQGAENPFVKEIGVAQSTKCDKIKTDMHICADRSDRRAAIRSCDYVH